MDLATEMFVVIAMNMFLVLVTLVVIPELRYRRNRPALAILTALPMGICLAPLVGESFASLANEQWFRDAGSVVERWVLFTAFSLGPMWFCHNRRDDRPRGFGRPLFGPPDRARRRDALTLTLTAASTAVAWILIAHWAVDLVDERGCWVLFTVFGFGPMWFYHIRRDDPTEFTALELMLAVASTAFAWGLMGPRAASLVDEQWRLATLPVRQISDHPEPVVMPLPLDDAPSVGSPVAKAVPLLLEGEGWVLFTALVGLGGISWYCLRRNSLTARRFTALMLHASVFAGGITALGVVLISLGHDLFEFLVAWRCTQLHGVDRHECMELLFVIFRSRVRHAAYGVATRTW